MPQPGCVQRHSLRRTLRRHLQRGHTNCDSNSAGNRVHRSTSSAVDTEGTPGRQGGAIGEKRGRHRRGVGRPLPRAYPGPIAGFCPSSRPSLARRSAPTSLGCSSCCLAGMFAKIGTSAPDSVWGADPRGAAERKRADPYLHLGEQQTSLGSAQSSRGMGV